MKINVLDHGFVRLVECWGCGDSQNEELGTEFEAGVIEAARQSTQGSFRGWKKDGKPLDERLLAFLYHNKHSTPFEFAGMVIEVKAPLFVFREWHRHRTQSYNEMSARYAPLPDQGYVPSIERIMHKSKDGNKQSGGVVGSEELTEHAARFFQKGLELDYLTFQAKYEKALQEGVPKELARIGMPVGRYSQMRASTNLRNWLAFLTLRMSSQAQWEIRQYAKAVAEIIEQQFPKTYKLFLENAE